MPKILKSTICIVIFMQLFIFISFASSYNVIPVVDASKKVYDFANLLTEEEEKILYEDISLFIDTYDLDMVVVTIDDNNDFSSRDYADDFYDYNDFGKNSTHDGILFLIDMDMREMWISTTGQGQLIYDDYRIERILDDTEKEIAKQKYYECASKFVKAASKYAKAGIPDSNSNAYVDNQGNYIVGNSKNEENLLVITAISFMVAFGFIIIVCMNHRMIKKAINAGYYLKEFDVVKRNDIFLTTHTSRIRMESSSGSGRGSSTGGGSSTHFSSSGRSHGGGGRRF